VIASFLVDSLRSKQAVPVTRDHKNREKQWLKLRS
jgi:hypothetical protein